MAEPEWVDAATLLASEQLRFLLPSEGALTWLVRSRRTELVEAGAMILGRGRRANLFSVKRMADAIPGLLKLPLE